jgi:hypothetical protein
MSNTSPTKVSIDEALQYDKDALEAEIEKIELNIELFEKAIADERVRIDKNRQMIDIITIHQHKK